MILPVPGAGHPRIGVEEDDREALLGQGHTANAGTEPSSQDAATSSPVHIWLPARPCVGLRLTALQPADRIIPSHLTLVPQVLPPAYLLGLSMERVSRF
ncbi:hypothetical protein A7C99_1650 [Trichophyton rubrum]|uniref:Uncharacterized protein n=1 Tax=Trichophyton rubrum TaxID=5551 RepID=A0A178F6K9_TRIRU|nr:hypothetical protein A7C99_1650 [Trichophyton rubrum]